MGKLVPKGLKEKLIVGPPDEDDWNITRYFIKFLKLFYGAILKFLGSLHVTYNIFMN
jgi:hypothetical protein